MARRTRRAPRFPHDPGRSKSIDDTSRRILFHDRVDVRRSSLVSTLLSRSLSLVSSHSDAVCFSAIFVWCAFQTGNSVQVCPSPPTPRLRPQRPLTVKILNHVACRHIHPSALHDGGRDLALEEWAGQRCFESRCPSVDQRGHVRVFRADQREHGSAGHHGQAYEHAIYDHEWVSSLSRRVSGHC